MKKELKVASILAVSTLTFLIPNARVFAARNIDVTNGVQIKYSPGWETHAIPSYSALRGMPSTTLWYHRNVEVYKRNVINRNYHLIIDTKSFPGKSCAVVFDTNNVKNGYKSFCVDKKNWATGALTAVKNALSYIGDIVKSAVNALVQSMGYILTAIICIAVAAAVVLLIYYLGVGLVAALACV